MPVIALRCVPTWSGPPRRVTSELSTDVAGHLRRVTCGSLANPILYTCTIRPPHALRASHCTRECRIQYYTCTMRPPHVLRAAHCTRECRVRYYTCTMGPPHAQTSRLMWECFWCAMFSGALVWLIASYCIEMCPHMEWPSPAGHFRT